MEVEYTSMWRGMKLNIVNEMLDNSLYHAGSGVLRETINCGAAERFGAAAPSLSHQGVGYSMQGNEWIAG